MAKQVRNFKIDIFSFGRVISSAFLILCFFDLPYGFYTLVRILVSTVSAYAAYIFLSKNFNRVGYIFIFLFLLFNPIIPIHFEKPIWLILDSVTATFLLSSLFWLKLPTFQQTNNQDKFIIIEGDNIFYDVLPFFNGFLNIPPDILRQRAYALIDRLERHLNNQIIATNDTIDYFKLLTNIAAVSVVCGDPTLFLRITDVAPRFLELTKPANRRSISLYIMLFVNKIFENVIITYRAQLIEKLELFKSIVLKRIEDRDTNEINQI